MYEHADFVLTATEKRKFSFLIFKITVKDVMGNSAVCCLHPDGRYYNRLRLDFLFYLVKNRIIPRQTSLNKIKWRWV